MALEKEFPDGQHTPARESVDAPTAGMTNGERGDEVPCSFKGKDLDGNDVNSDELLSKNKVTVMNFWFTTCKPCVGELGDLEKLNKELAEKGGQVVGVNSFTLDGNKDEVADAKDVLSKKGVTYKNIWFKSTVIRQVHLQPVLVPDHLRDRPERQHRGRADHGRYQLR